MHVLISVSVHVYLLIMRFSIMLWAILFEWNLVKIRSDSCLSDICLYGIQSSSPGCLNCPPVSSRESVVLPSSTAHSSYLAAYHLNKLRVAIPLHVSPSLLLCIYTHKALLFLFVHYVRIITCDPVLLFVYVLCLYIHHAFYYHLPCYYTT